MREALPGAGYVWLAAAGFAGLWLYASHTMVRLRREWVRIPPSNAATVPSAEDGTTFRFAGTMVRRWDRLTLAQKRRLDLLRWAGGVGVLAMVLLNVCMRLF